MSSFLDSLRQIRLGLCAAFCSPHVRALLALTFTFIGLASVFYWWVEGWQPADAVYFSVMTIATVGYGDFSPHTTAGKLFTIFYVLCGLGLFVAAATAVADSVIQNIHQRDKE